MQGYWVIEGVDGVGKTTVLRTLANQLLANKVDFILTKEPGGPKALAAEWQATEYPFGELYDGFRELCVNNPQIPQLAKRALYKADSFYNWLNVVKPALAANKLVLSDRSWVSDIAYGTALAKVPAEALYQFNTALVPEQAALTNVIYLDCPEDVREARLATNVIDHADLIGVEARRAVQAAYIHTLETYVSKYHVIDTNQPVLKIVDSIINNCLQ